MFLVGLGTLLLLIFMPGLAALRQSAAMFAEIRQIRAAHEKTQQTLFIIERRILQASILVRDFMLDTAPDVAPRYKDEFRQIRTGVEQQLLQLTEDAGPSDLGGLDRLQDQVTGYCSTLQPVFDWTPAQRELRGTYFLREQQRPRRESVLAIAEQIGALATSNYRRRYADFESSQRTYRRQLGIAVGIAFLLGVIVAIATTIRIAILEKRTAQHQRETERAEREMRSLSARLMQAQEEERRTISRELHDEVGQSLTALRMELAALERLRTANQEEFATHLDEAKTISEQALRTVRDIAVGLRPSVLDLGLGPALQWQARQFSRRTGIEVNVEIDDLVPPIRDDTATCVYRILQEALTNSARHAEAKRVEIRVSSAEGILEATIRDDGIGLRDGWDKGRGLGLIGMEERARELGGAVHIRSQAGKGLMIRVNLPLPREGAA